MPNQDYTLKPVRSAAILTGSYVAGTVLENCERFDQLILYVKFTIGSLDSAEIKVEFSNDKTNYYQESAGSEVSGTDTVSLVEHQLSGTGNFRLAIPIKDRYIKVSVKGTGTATSSSMQVDAILGTTA